MKLDAFRIQEREKGKQELAIHIEDETQKEANLLIHAANRFPSSVKIYGKVGEQSTWAWILIPLKQGNYRDDYFGNENL